MKKLKFCIGVLLFTFSQLNLSAQSNNNAFTEVDKALIKLHQSAINKDFKSCRDYIGIAEDHWILDRQNLTQVYTCNPKEDLSICNIDGLFSILSMSMDVGDYVELKNYTETLIFELSSLRHETTKIEYPLDVLWRMYQEYYQMHIAIHDQMFDLKEWFEFEDMINAIAKQMEIYTSLEEKQITKLFPNIKIEDHNSHVDKMGDCFLYFLSSLESGYQDDFEWPCDELGTSIYNLILLYSQ